MGRGVTSGRNTARRLIAEAGITGGAATRLLRRAGQTAGESGTQAGLNVIRRAIANR